LAHSLALRVLPHGLRTSSLALHKQCGAFYWLAQFSFPSEYCTAFIFGSIKEHHGNTNWKTNSRRLCQSTKGVWASFKDLYKPAFS
jgi:hypothetical protein